MVFIGTENYLRVMPRDDKFIIPLCSLFSVRRASGEIKCHKHILHRSGFGAHQIIFRLRTEISLLC